MKHTTSGDTTTISGRVANVSADLILIDVAVAIEFNGGRVRKVVAGRLEPGAEVSFEFELSTVTQYRVFVDSYSPMPSGDIRDEVKGNIDWTVYPSRVREALIRGIEADASLSLRNVVGGIRFYTVTVKWRFRPEASVPANVTLVSVEIEVYVRIEKARALDSPNPGAPSYEVRRRFPVGPGERLELSVTQDDECSVIRDGKKYIYKCFSPVVDARVVDVIFK